MMMMVVVAIPLLIGIVSSSVHLDERLVAIEIVQILGHVRVEEGQNVRTIGYDFVDIITVPQGKSR